MNRIALLLALGALTTACNDDSLQAVQYGALRVSPTAVELEGACAFEERTVVLESVGEFAVRVDAVALEGEGWVVLEGPSLPLRMEPGETADVVVLGQHGSASLVVASDDPDAPVQRVSLEGTPNTPPTLSWVAPMDGDIVLPGSPLQVTVTDAEESTEDLVVTWTSDVDGVVALALVDASGTATGLWLDGTGGEHTLTAEVTDRCGAPGNAVASICRQEGYQSDALDLSTWVFEGSASYDTAQEWVELTDTAGTFQLGSAFQTTTTNGSDVSIAFRFFVSGGTGADGFAVTALDTDRATSYLAHPGGCLGYGGGPVCGNADPLFGWSIEVDTFFSPGVDPTEADHVSFHFDGDVAGYEVFAVLPEMEDGNWHEMTIDVAAPHVTVAIDGVTYIDQDLDGDFDFPAQVGFTAATGGETNFHLIDDLTVIEDACPGAKKP